MVDTLLEKSWSKSSSSFSLLRVFLSATIFGLFQNFDILDEIYFVHWTDFYVKGKLFCVCLPRHRCSVESKREIHYIAQFRFDLTFPHETSTRRKCLDYFKAHHFVSKISLKWLVNMYYAWNLFLNFFLLFYHFSRHYHIHF